MVTMATTPKSAGVSSRARMTVLTTWTAKASAWANTVAAAPRTARRRNSPSLAIGWNAPLASNGVILSLRSSPPVDTPSSKPPRMSQCYWLSTQSHGPAIPPPGRV